MTTSPKGTIVDTNNLQLGELIHINFALQNVTSISAFNSMLTFVCTKTRKLWVFPTAPKKTFRIIRFILTTPNNEKTIQKCDS